MKRLVLTFLLAVVVLTVSGCSDGMDEEPRADTSKMFVRVEIAVLLILCTTKIQKLCIP
mgnify:CR=1 FL=1